MRLVLSIALLILFANITGFSQRTAAEAVREQQIRRASQITHGIETESQKDYGLNELNRMAATGTLEEKLKLERIKSTYRGLNEKETELVAPSTTLLAQYAGLLSDNSYGLVTLFPDQGCDEITFLNAATDKCSVYTMPGGGSAYSFRSRKYRVWRLADMLYDGKNFIAFGQVSQGFLGRFPVSEIADINLNSNAKFVADFKPESEFAGITKQNLEFAKAVKHAGVEFSKVVPVETGGVYVIRSVAYKGYAWRTREGVPYNELQLDDRNDIIVAFKVVSRQDDGGVTILWKELRSKESPTIRDSTK